MRPLLSSLLLISASAGIVMARFAGGADARPAPQKPQYPPAITAEMTSILSEAIRDAGKATKPSDHSAALSAVGCDEVLCGAADHGRATLAESRGAAYRVADWDGRVLSLLYLAGRQHICGDDTGSRQSYGDAISAIASHPAGSQEDKAQADYYLEKTCEATSKLEFLSEALRAAQLTHDSQMKSIDLALVAEHEMNNGDISSARRTIHNIDGRSAEEILCEISTVQFKHGDKAGALDTIQEAIQATRTIMPRFTSLEGCL